MDLAKRLKSAYDICVGRHELIQAHKDTIHYYLGIRTILFKITTGGAPDVEQMNQKVRELVRAVLISDGVEEIFKLGESNGGEIDLFDDDYLAKLEAIKQPNTKLQLLQKLLAKAIGELKKTNKAELQFDLMVLLDEWGYPPIDRGEVYKEIFEQAENSKKHRAVT